jgi:peptide/nickel transport system permease protein
MTTYIIQRLLRGIVVLLGVTFIVFALIHISGDPISVLLPLTATESQKAALRADLNLDKPLSFQYITFLKHALQGDFGKSLRYRQPALPIIIKALPNTILVMIVGVISAILLAIPTGILSALYKGSWIDFISQFGAILGQSLPNFWFAIILILLFAVELHWLPVSGIGSWKNLILPGITEGVFIAPVVSRLLRSSLLEVLSQDYIKTAKAKGLPWRTVVIKHALRNALLPVITVIGMQIGALFGGAVIVEMVFAYPGMGRVAVEAVNSRDLPLIQAFVAVTSFFVIVINLITDLVYAKVDPRISLTRGSGKYG